METDDSLHVLRKAASGMLPNSIDGSSEIPVHVVEELVDAGYLKASRYLAYSGPIFNDARITTAGREYLASLEAQCSTGSFWIRVRPTAKWVLGIVAAVVTAVIVKWLIG